MINYVFYNMMISQWQLAFAGSAHMELSDTNYMLKGLVRYMTMQETIMNQHTSAANDRNRNRTRGNFSFGCQPTRHSHQPYSNAQRMYWQPHHQQNHPSSFPPFPCRQSRGWEQPWDQQIPQWDYQRQPQPGCYMSRVPMQQTLAMGTTKTQVEEVPTMGIHDHTTILALTLRHREFILQMLLVLYTLEQGHYKIMHTTTMILTHPNYSFQTHTATPKRIIMLKINKMTIAQLLQIRTMNTIQLDMKRDMDIKTSNTLINTLDNHLCWRQWHLKNGVIMLTKFHITSR